MERTEPSFIPGWLKGTGGGGGSTTHNSSDEGGFSRSKVSQQLLHANSNLESPRKSTSSSKAFSSTSRRSHNTNGSVDRPSSERDHFGLSRSKSGLNRSSSIRNHSKLNLEQNGYNSWIDGEYGHEVDKDFYARKKDWLSGMVPDGRDKDKEVADSSMRQLFSAGLTGKYDLGAKLKRSQSMSLTASGKVTDVISSVPSANGNIAVNAQKSVFEHNFPTLGTDDKQSSPRSSSIASPRPSFANPHLIRQGTSRSDLSRASSPGVTGGYANPMASVSASNSGGNDLWSSALADAPTSNGNVQCNSLTSNAVPSASISQTSSFAGPVTSAAPLNMAEALTQNPPRVRTPPQVSLESQRLEELALRQSRQLIPMTPSLPKAMSLVDKTKSKSSRVGEGLNPSLKLQLSSSQKSVTSSKPDNLKLSQGKLLVLKSSKDGGVVMTTTPKSDGNVVSQVATQGPSAVSAGSSTLAQRKQPVDRRVTGVADVSRAKDASLLPDEKRTALNAQNRSDFFNTLRKKAAGNGASLNASTVQTKNDSLMPRETALASEVGPVDNDVEVKENGIHHHSSFKVQCNGEVNISSEDGSTKDVLVKDNPVVLPKEESRHSLSPGDLEEEEAAFMRSLGWVENEEGSELTEEEINAFYQTLQMHEKKKFLKSKSTGEFQAEHVVGSVGSMSSGLSSSDSETEEVPSFLLRR